MIVLCFLHENKVFLFPNGFGLVPKMLPARTFPIRIFSEFLHPFQKSLYFWLPLEMNTLTKSKFGIFYFINFLSTLFFLFPLIIFQCSSLIFYHWPSFLRHPTYPSVVGVAISAWNYGRCLMLWLALAFLIHLVFNYYKLLFIFFEYFS